MTRDLAALGPVKLHGSVSHDVLRWLKHCGGILQRHPRWVGLIFENVWSYL